MKTSAFPFASICVFAAASILCAASGMSYLFYARMYPRIVALNKHAKQMEMKHLQDEDYRRRRGFLMRNLSRSYYQLIEKDENRFYDCKWKSEGVTPQPFYAYPYLKFFNSKSTTDIFNGITEINNWPSLLYVNNLDHYEHGRSRILLGIRGSDYGIHKSNLPMELVSLLKRNPDYSEDLIFLPDNYVYISPDGHDITNDDVQAACHNRTYAGGRYVSNYWNSFDAGKFWDMYDQILTNDDYVVNNDVFIFAYSNGSSPRHQLMKTRQVGQCSSDSIEEYTACHEFTDERAFRVKAIVDLETNYDTNNLLPTAMFVNKNIRGYTGRYYYALCASEDCPIGNHYTLANLLKLRPRQMEPGYVRYQDADERIIVDIIDYRGPLHYSHSTVIPLGIKQFEEISRHGR